jgi:hypothetical protein
MCAIEIYLLGVRKFLKEHTMVIIVGIYTNTKRRG